MVTGEPNANRDATQKHGFGFEIRIMTRRVQRESQEDHGEQLVTE